MKRFIAAFAFAAIALSCTANVPISPDPTSASTGVGGNGGAGGFGGNGASSNSSAASSGSSSGGPIPGDSSGTRLRRYVYTSADGLTTPRDGWMFDALLDMSCVPRETPMGLRCAPWSFAYTGYFVDPACTTPAAIATKGCLVLKYHTTTKANACGSFITSQVYPLTPIQMQPLYRNDNAMCAAAIISDPSASDYYSVGPEIDYATLAPMSLVVE
jgi:hypothetical protein